MDKKKTNINATQILLFLLLVFGVIISAPRFAGAFAIAVGIDIFEFQPWMQAVEIYSGIALAGFEALSFAFITHKWRNITVLSDDSSLPFKERIYVQNLVYWAVLAIGQMMLLITIPTISVVHLITQQFDAQAHEVLTWTHIWNNHLTWLWSFLVSGAQTLFVFLIGLAIDEYVLGGTSDRSIENYSTSELLQLSKELENRGLATFSSAPAPPPISLDGREPRIVEVAKTPPRSIE